MQVCLHAFLLAIFGPRRRTAFEYSLIMLAEFLKFFQVIGSFVRGCRPPLPLLLLSAGGWLLVACTAAIAGATLVLMLFFIMRGSVSFLASNTRMLVMLHRSAEQTAAAAAAVGAARIGPQRLQEIRYARDRELESGAALRGVGIGTEAPQYAQRLVLPTRYAVLDTL